MAKRRKIKKPEVVSRKKRLADKKRDILEGLEFTYELGMEALAESEVHRIRGPEQKSDSETLALNREATRKKRATPYARRVITGLATKHNVHFNTVEIARKIVKCYGKKQFRQLMSRRTSEGLPLTTNHFTQLSFVKDLTRRAKFEDQALAHNWSIRKLAAAIKEDQIKHGHSKATVGNKPVIPDTLPGVVRQIIDSCDKWRRWSNTFSAEIENRGGDMQPKLSGICRKLALLDSQIETIHATATALVAPRKAKSPKSSSRTSHKGRSKRKSARAVHK